MSFPNPSKTYIFPHKELLVMTDLLDRNIQTSQNKCTQSVLRKYSCHLIHNNFQYFDRRKNTRMSSYHEGVKRERAKKKGREKHSLRKFSFNPANVFFRHLSVPNLLLHFTSFLWASTKKEKARRESIQSMNRS